MSLFSRIDRLRNGRDDRDEESVFGTPSLTPPTAGAPAEEPSGAEPSAPAASSVPEPEPKPLSPLERLNRHAGVDGAPETPRSSTPLTPSVAFPNATEPRVAEKAPGISPVARLAEEEKAARESGASQAQSKTDEPSAPSSSGGGTAFDRLMAARAQSSEAKAPETGRTSAPTLAERLAAMRAQAELENELRARHQPPTGDDLAPEPDLVPIVNSEATLEEVLAPPSGANSSSSALEPFQTGSVVELPTTSPEDASSRNEALTAPDEVNQTVEAASSLDAALTHAAPTPEPAVPEAMMAESAPVAPAAVSAPLTSADSSEETPSVHDYSPVAPPSQEIAAVPPAPIPLVAQAAGSGEDASLTRPDENSGVPTLAQSAPSAPLPSSPWAQRLAGRDALRDAPLPSRSSAAPVASSEALDNVSGPLARVEEAMGEAESRNRSLYRQKHIIFDAVLGALDPRVLPTATRETIKAPIERAVDLAGREFNLGLDGADRSWMIEEFIREIVDLGPLVSLLDDVTVNKVLVVGSTDVAVERFGRIERTGVSFRDDDHLLSVVRRIAELTGGRVDAKVPLLDRPLPDGARIRAKIPPLSPQPTLTIEKSSGNPFIALKRQQAERGRENALPYAQLRERIQQRLLREFEGNAAALSNPDRLRVQVEEMIGQVIAEERVAVTRAERASLVMDLLNEIVGLGPIEPLLNDPDVDEVMVNGPFQIYVERKGKLEIAPQRFRDNNHVMQVIERIVAPLGRRVDEKSPMVDGRLRDGSRFNAVIPPLALNGPTMTIRKFARDPFTMTDLINFGTISREAAQFLQAAVEGRMNIVVSGGTGSGKTTTLNVLSSFIPSNERIVTIEDAAELQLRQEHVVRLETRPANIEGAGEITIRDLVRNALRMRPDRIVIGECRGAEALDMLQAMNTGHDGSLTTGHSNGPRDTIKRLETMVMMSGFDLPVKAIREQIAMAVQFIVHQERMRDGKRRVSAITEIVGMEGDVVTMQDVFRFEQERVDEEGRIIGALVPTGLRPHNYDNITDHGGQLSMELFQPRGDRNAELRYRLNERNKAAR